MVCIGRSDHLRAYTSLQSKLTELFKMTCSAVIMHSSAIAGAHVAHVRLGQLDQDNQEVYAMLM